MDELQEKDSAIIIGHNFVRRVKIIAMRHKKENFKYQAHQHTSYWREEDDEEPPTETV